MNNDPRAAAPGRRSRAMLDLPAYGLAAATLSGFAGGWHWLLDLASHFRWPWLVAAAVWLVVTAGRRTRAATACLVLTAAANAWVLLPYWRPAPAAPAAEEGAAPLRIVSLNVLASNPRKDAVVAYLRARAADVVVLLEIDAAWAAALRGLDPLYPHRLVAPRDDMFGIAVLSRIPLEDPRVVQPGDGTPMIVAGVAGGGRRCLLVAAHPPAPISKAWSARRDAQLAAIGDLAAAESRPVIVAGDLNATPWSHGFRRLVARRGLRDSAVGRGVQGTWNARLWAPRIPIDHVVVSDDVRVRSRSLGPDVGSDHLPVEATLSLPPAAPAPGSAP